MIKKILVVIGGLAILAGRSIFAMDHGGMRGHGGHEEREMTREVPADKGFSKIVRADEIAVAFYIETSEAHMKAMGNMKHGDMKMDDKEADKHMEELKKFSHHISVSFSNDATKEAVEVKDAKIKVTSPDKKEETKDLFWMAGMKHYGALFNLGAKGKYGVEVEFKVGDKAENAKFIYEAK